VIAGADTGQYDEVILGALDGVCGGDLGDATHCRLQKLHLGAVEGDAADVEGSDASRGEVPHQSLDDHDVAAVDAGFVERFTGRRGVEEDERILEGARLVSGEHLSGVESTRHRRPE